MRVESVTIKGFRLFEEATVSLDELTTIIVGRNNSGKTSFVELFYKFFRVEKVDRFTIDDLSRQQRKLLEEAGNAWTQARKYDEEGNQNVAIVEENRAIGKLPRIMLEVEFSYNDSEPLTPLAELILEQPLFLAHGDKIILRNSNSTAVLGGAKVIEIHSPKRHKRTEARFDYLRQLIQAETAEKRTALYLQNHAVEAEQLMWIEQLTDTQLDNILEKNGDIRFQSWCFNADYRAQQTSKLLTALAQYHEQHPDQLGLGKARLYRIAALNQPEKLIYHFIDELLAENQLQQTRGWLHTADHKIQFNEQERALWQQVLEQFEQHNGQALWVRDLAGLLGQEESAMRNFLYKAGKLGYLTAVVKDRFFLTENIYATARLIKQLVAGKEGISVNELRDALQFGRKMTVQLVEYFDRCGFLRRKGNIHVLRDADVFDL